MYLGDDRLASLACFVQGVIRGLGLAGVARTGDELLLEDFGGWLGKVVDSQNGDCWFYLSIPDDRTGEVQDFYRFFDQFLQHKGYEGGLADEALAASHSVG